MPPIRAAPVTKSPRSERDMPMNKIVSVPPAGSPKAAAAKAVEPIADLREWLSRVEAIGELTRVVEPVDRDEEMSAISYLVAKQQPSPAVLFERPRGFDKSPIGAKMLWNILGPSVSATRFTVEEPADTPTVELIRRVKDKLKRRLPPNEVSVRRQTPLELVFHPPDQFDCRRVRRLLDCERDAFHAGPQNIPQHLGADRALVETARALEQD